MRPTRHVALLRSLNVGGANRLPMQDLRAAAAAIGWSRPATYVQSGNLLFEAEAPRAADLSEALLERHGLSVGVILRTADDLRHATASCPFAAEAASAPRTVHVAFLREAPDPDRSAALDPDRSPPDRLALQHDLVFLHCPNGLGRSRITLDWLERRLGVLGTVRGYPTITALRDLATAPTHANP